MREKLSGIEVAGLLAALLPFVCHLSSVTRINGVTTSYFDLVGVIGGLVAIVVALMLASRHWPILKMGLAYVALCIGILVVGVYQLLHGAGLLMVG